MNYPNTGGERKPERVPISPTEAVEVTNDARWNSKWQFHYEKQKFVFDQFVSRGVALEKITRTLLQNYVYFTQKLDSRRNLFLLTINGCSGGGKTRYVK